TMTQANKDNATSTEMSVQPTLHEDLEPRSPKPDEIRYAHSSSTTTLNPTAPPPPGTDYVSKTNGNLEYLLEAGIDPLTRKRQFPSGKYPRLIMSWIAKQIRKAGHHKTEYVDPDTHTITIPSIGRLCEQIGVPRGGATMKKVQEQLRLLLSCRISIRSTGGFVAATVNDVVYLPLIKASRTVDTDNISKSGAAFILTEEVYERLGGESAPYDTRAGSYLLSGRSVLPYDVYVWMIGSMYRLRKPMAVTWQWLRERFGDNFDTEMAFRRAFRNALKKVQVVYPAARFTTSTSGVTLYPSPLAITHRQAHEAEWAEQDANRTTPTRS
ncbi:replication protein RepA, partial [Bifidobacterium pseudolongum]|uniref:replication protein RepA n=2 Tax=Bifidobacterium pseudolongum TaxID=1694 RepID=UPI001020BFC5